MCINVAKLKENFYWAKKEASMLSFRRFLSDYHASRWIDFEKILTIRTLLGSFMRITLSAIGVVSGTENWDLA